MENFFTDLVCYLLFSLHLATCVLCSHIQVDKKGLFSLYLLVPFLKIAEKFRKWAHLSNLSLGGPFFFYTLQNLCSPELLCLDSVNKNCSLQNFCRSVLSCVDSEQTQISSDLVSVQTPYRSVMLSVEFKTWKNWFIRASSGQMQIPVGHTTECLS